MMDNYNSLTLPEIEDHETKKYKKHINDLFENAEIEAEIEAEKKIRSKNSRIFLISMCGFGLLGLVYLLINSQNGLEVASYDELILPIQIPIKSADAKMTKKVSMIKNGNTHIPISPLIKAKSFVEPDQIAPEKKLYPVLNPKVKSKLNEINRISSSLKTNNTFFVQTGAFSLKENANTLVKNLEAKGFNPSVHVIANGPKKTYLVQLGVFPNKEKAKLIQEKLARAGYPKTIIK